MLGRGFATSGAESIDPRPQFCIGLRIGNSGLEILNVTPLKGESLRGGGRHPSCIRPYTCELEAERKSELASMVFDPNGVIESEPLTTKGYAARTRSLLLP